MELSALLGIPIEESAVLRPDQAFYDENRNRVVCGDLTLFLAHLEAALEFSDDT